MVSEIFPLRTRGRGISLAVLTNFGSNAIVTFAFAPLKVVNLKWSGSACPVFYFFRVIENSVFCFAGVARSWKCFPPFWGYCFAIALVCSPPCPRDQRFELGRNRVQNTQVKAVTPYQFVESSMTTRTFTNLLMHVSSQLCKLAGLLKCFFSLPSPNTVNRTSKHSQLITFAQWYPCGWYDSLQSWPDQEMQWKSNILPDDHVCTSDCCEAVELLVSHIYVRTRM